jgi:site-specific recombinase XerC
MGARSRCKLSAVSSLFAYLCERNAVVHNPVKGVKRPKGNTNEGLTLALSDEQASLLLNAPLAEPLKGKRDRAIPATLLSYSQNIRTRLFTGDYASNIAALRLVFRLTIPS